MEAVLEKALKLHAHKRYSTAREMREALEGSAAAPTKAAQSHVGSSPPPAKAAQTPAQAAQSHASPVPAPSLPATVTNTRDGADMILIPAGDFLMGSTAGKGLDNERPQHRVFLDAYYIYTYEVTNGQFARFVKETGYNRGLMQSDRGPDFLKRKIHGKNRVNLF